MPIWEKTETPESVASVRYQVIRRSGAVVPFEPANRVFALMSAFAVAGGLCSTGTPLTVNAFVCAVLVAARLKKSIPALDGLRSYSRQRLGTINLKQAFNGFFSANKANLRNAP